MSRVVRGFSVHSVTVRRFGVTEVMSGRPQAATSTDTPARMHLYPGTVLTDRRAEGQEGIRTLKGSFAGMLRVANDEDCTRADVVFSDFYSPGQVKAYEVQSVNPYAMPSGAIGYTEFEAGELKGESL